MKTIPDYLQVLELRFWSRVTQTGRQMTQTPPQQHLICTAHIWVLKASSHLLTGPCAAPWDPAPDGDIVFGGRKTRRAALAFSLTRFLAQTYAQTNA